MSGFCIKLFNVNNFAIFSQQDLRGKSVPMKFGNPSYVLFRVGSNDLGAEWLKSLKKAIPDWEASTKIAETAGFNLTDSSSEEAEAEEQDSDHEVTESTLSFESSSSLAPALATSPPVSITPLSKAPSTSIAVSSESPPLSSSPPISVIVPNLLSVPAPAVVQQPTALPSQSSSPAKPAAAIPQQPTIVASLPSTPAKPPATVQQRNSISAPSSSIETASIDLFKAEITKKLVQNVADINNAQKELEEKVKVQITGAEQRLGFLVKSTTAQLKKENQVLPAEKKAGPLAAAKTYVTPNTILLFLIFWLLWSINSNLAALQNQHAT
jgi:hypothetical protein